jgi:hypothetical protein
MGRIGGEIGPEAGARLDRDLLAVEGLYTCPTCWGGDEVCEACDGAGLVPVRT